MGARRDAARRRRGLRGATARRGSAAIATSGLLERRLLWHAVEVEGDPRVIDHLAGLIPDAAHPVPVLRSMRYTARAEVSGFVVTEDGEVLTTVATATAAADAIHVRAHRRAFELASLSGWARVHGATVDLDGTRLLVIGPSGAGKTTLATRLLLDGADVQGDESVLVRRGASLAVPRALHLKPGAAAWLPELADVVPDLPVVGDVTVLDPARLGHPLRLVVAPVDHVVLLTTAEPGGVSCARVDGGAVVEALLRGAFPITETKARIVSVVAGAVLQARGHRLTMGPPAVMIEALQSAIR